MIKKEMRKSISTLLAAALLSLQLVVPATAAEVSQETGVAAEVTTEAVAESGQNEDELTTQSVDSKISGYSISLNKGYFYKYDKGTYIRPAVDIVLSGNKVVAHFDADTNSNHNWHSGTVSNNNGWHVYYQANYCASDSSDYKYGTYGTAAVVAYNTDQKAVISETFKIVKEKQLKLSKVKVYGVEPRESTSSYNAKQDEARLFYYDAETLHYYPLIEGVDYKVDVNQTSAKKGTVVFSPASGSVWDGSKKQKYSIQSKKKKAFSDPEFFKVSMNYTKNGVKYDMSNFEEIEYTGSKIKSEIEVNVYDAEGHKLTSGSDYKVKYIANKAVGIATIKIVPMGSYKSTYQGSILRYFRIMPYQMTPKYENYISSGTTKQTRNPYLQQFGLGFSSAKGYHASSAYSNGTGNTYSYSYTGKVVLPTKTRLDYEGESFSVAKSKGKTVIYVLNAKNKHSKTYDNNNPTSTPTCYVFGKGNYGGYAGSYRYTIKTSGSDSDDDD